MNVLSQTNYNFSTALKGKQILLISPEFVQILDNNLTLVEKIDK